MGYGSYDADSRGEDRCGSEPEERPLWHEPIFQGGLLPVNPRSSARHGLSVSSGTISPVCMRARAAFSIALHGASRPIVRAAGQPFFEQCC